MGKDEQEMISRKELRKVLRKLEDGKVTEGDGISNKV